jgi:AICAR transformylase/IMP cyclohydrolase PurH
MNKIQRALISVSDKTGIAEFAQGLDALGIGPRACSRMPASP